MQVTIQHSTSAGGTYEEVGRFPLLTKGTNMPGVFVTRFLSTRMADGSTPTHVRALINVTDASGSDFTVASVYIFITDNAQIVGW
jgi:hypothetical protein